MLPLRVILADDHEETRILVAKLLVPEIIVIKAVSNGLELLEAVGKHVADVLTIDISMPCLDGFETMNRLRQTDVRTPIVCLTAFHDKQFITQALAVGALGYVVKSHLVSDLAIAIQEANQGRKFISPSLKAG